MDEEIYWKQRSRADRLREGDKNTTFFLVKASTHRRKNKIWEIEDNQEKWLDNRDNIKREFCEYFQSLFRTSNPSHVQIQDVLTGIQPKMTS